MTTENQRHIPAGWKESELGAVIVEKAKSTIKVSDAANFGEYPFFTSGDSILLHDKKIIEGENLFLATGGVANIKYFDGEAAYSTDTFAISTNQETKAQYLYYYLLSKVGYINKNYFEGSGLKHLQKKDFRKHAFVLPSSPTEQQKIASILSKLDEAITQTEQLIAKYKKIKEGLMHDLLTRGIDEQGNIRSEETHKFKDSPLGRIPREWEVDKLISFCDKIQDGTHFSPITDSNGSYKYITSKNIRMGFLDLYNLEYVNENEHRKIYNRCSVKYNDVLLTKDGASTGNICINTLSEEFSLLSSVALIRGNVGKLLNEYILQYFMFEKGQKSLTEQMSGNAITRITLTKIKNTQIIVPPIQEQKRIILKLKESDKLIFAEKEKLSKLDLQKSGLMHDLLTGKIRVQI